MKRLLTNGVQLASCPHQTRKEVKTMKYEKPVVVRLASATEAIQHPIDKGPQESNDNPLECSLLAYPADE